MLRFFRKFIKDNSSLRVIYSRFKAIFANILLPNYSNEMIIVGITGTDGKTSSSYFLAQTLEKLWLEVWLSCSEFIRNGEDKQTNFTKRTTPNPFFIRQFLAKCYRNNVKVVVLEVSAHALSQWRILWIKFDFVAITNITPEHLDYYDNMLHYAKTKSRLFQMFKKKSKYKISIINSKVWEYLNMFLWWNNKKYIIWQDSSTDLLADHNFQYGQNIYFCNYHIDQQNINQIKFDVNLDWKKVKNNKINMFGNYNVENVIISMIVANELGSETSQITNAVWGILPAPGRMNLTASFGKKENDSIKVFLDYAVTPDALQNILSNTSKILEKNWKSGKLWIVFGCTGWNHDHTKRAPMWNIASKFADKVVLTEDERYGEDAEKIVSEILTWVEEKFKHKIIVEYDRTKAIELALQNSTDGDIIIITGMAWLSTRNTKYGEISRSEPNIISDWISRSL